MTCSSRPFATVLLMLLLAGPASASERMEIITLRHATADQLLPALRPLMPAEARLSGFKNQILISADPATIAELIKVISSLDRPPKRLLLHIAHQEQSLQSRGEVSASARILVGDGEVVLGDAGPRNGTRIRIGQGNASQSGSSTQQIQTIEGAAAMIRKGQVRPLVEYYEDASGRSYSRVVEQDATRGTYAVTRLVGQNQVQVEIYSQNNRPGRGGRLQVQEADSVIRGRIGEWLEFAGDTSNESRQERELTARVGGDQASAFSFRIKVEVLD